MVTCLIRTFEVKVKFVCCMGIMKHIIASKKFLTGAQEHDEKSGEAPIQLANPDGIWTLPFKIPINETKVNRYLKVEFYPIWTF